jgi:SAM-dependent methyltransferase
MSHHQLGMTELHRPTVLERAAAHGSPLRHLLSRMWRRYTMHLIGPNDNHAALEQLYALPDPWNLTAPSEHSRFVQTNAVLQEVAGNIETMLEIGCGEGHQSEHLSKLCKHLYGVDVSRRAVARAQARSTLLLNCQFGVGDLAELPWTLGPGEKYDLVVACEVLYYLSDINAALRHMSRLGRRCFVTFYCPRSNVVVSHLAQLPNLRRGWINHDSCAWLWAYWIPTPTVAYPA